MPGGDGVGPSSEEISMTKSDKVPISADDLKVHFQEQLDFLQKSAHDFDEGDETEYKRIANALRILLHDSRSCHSLIGQLSLKGTTRFFDCTIPLNDLAINSQSVGTCFAPTDSELKILPWLDSVPTINRRLDFDTWWENTTFILDANNNRFSRRLLVTFVAEQGGGSHVDSSLGKEFSDLTKQGALGITYGSSPEDSELVFGVERAALRQICHEVLKTFIPGYTKKLEDLALKGIHGFIGGGEITMETAAQFEARMKKEFSDSQLGSAILPRAPLPIVPSLGNSIILGKPARNRGKLLQYSKKKKRDKKPKRNRR